MAVTITRSQVGQKISVQDGQEPAFSLASLACGFGVGRLRGAVTGEVDSAAESGVLWDGFASFLPCSCSFFTGDCVVGSPLIIKTIASRRAFIRSHPRLLL